MNRFLTMAFPSARWCKRRYHHQPEHDLGRHEHTAFDLREGPQKFRQLIRRDGSVVARSDGIGQGSEFIVTLPLSAQRLQTAAPVEPDGCATGHCSVLLVEDNVDACPTLSSFLESEGHTVSTAQDGLSGLETALQGSFDVLVCDIGLPGMDGFGLIAELRRAAQSKQPYAIALSGYGQE